MTDSSRTRTTIRVRSHPDHPRLITITSQIIRDHAGQQQTSMEQIHQRATHPESAPFIPRA